MVWLYGFAIGNECLLFEWILGGQEALSPRLAQDLVDAALLNNGLKQAHQSVVACWLQQCQPDLS